MKKKTLDAQVIFLLLAVPVVPPSILNSYNSNHLAMAQELLKVKIEPDTFPPLFAHGTSINDVIIFRSEGSEIDEKLLTFSEKLWNGREGG